MESSALSKAKGRLSVAPMLCVTNGPFRTLARLLSRQAVLYTEMLPADAMIQGNPDILSLPTSLTHASEATWADAAGPFAVQLGGSHPETMAAAARKVLEIAPASLVEINLNCGCPGKTVARNSFGAGLMRTPDQVQAIAASVRAVVPNTVDVTVKMRLGVDEHDSFEQLVEFVRTVSAPPASVTRFIVHARKAILGLSARENTEVPPLRWDWVEQLCQVFPSLQFDLNGGVHTLDEVDDLLSGKRGFAGVMVGRAVRDNPWGLLADADSRIYGRLPTGTESMFQDVATEYARYADDQLAMQLAIVEASEELRKRPHERRELRKRLWQPILALFSGHVGAASSLKAALERKMGMSRAVKAALKTIPDRGLNEEPWERSDQPCCGG